MLEMDEGFGGTGVNAELYCNLHRSIRRALVASEESSFTGTVAPNSEP
jgi:hypothetical protein